MMKLVVNDLYLNFGGTNALTGVSLEITEGEILAVIGPNGAGKTCLLNCISGFYHPQKGDIYFDSRRISEMAIHQRPNLGIARTFQNPGLFMGLTTVENLLAARHIHLKPGVLSSAIYFGWEHRKDIRHRKVVEEIMDFLEITPIRHKVVGTLGYGLRRRVELGVALALEPKLMLLDEPSLGLAPILVKQIFDIIHNINQEGTAILLVEQNARAALSLAQYSYVMENGRIVLDCPAAELRNNEDVQEFYLGLSKLGQRKSYREVKHYARRKRWL